MKKLTKARQIRISTVNSAVQRMGKLPGFTRIEIDRLLFFPEYFTEIVRQSAYTLARYKHVSIDYLQKNKSQYVSLKEILNEVLFTVDKCAEPFHVLIALRMLSAKIYAKVVINKTNPEETILPLILVKKELPPRHHHIPSNRYFAELDDTFKEEKGFYLKLEVQE
ncbi:hypothetical protein [Silvanigrella aquatica]|uniref:Uncharacterized protein n=1 Tax=Silvanigrella aquatica TaxID=1915309 RepID=A0A1L4D167_9BACT|nr:hypothetical protein [Silvanigrella aquatica]APJ03952.1 hypothetical protein AXG55_08550 [Silvanigrella aquatica]